MRRRLLVGGLVLAATVTAAGPAVATADAAPHRPAITVLPATVVQQDPVTVSGATTQRRVTVYRRLYGGPWTRLGTASAHHGRFAYRTRPVPGRTNLYRTSAPGTIATSSSAVAHSVGCTPLPAHGSVATWVQDATVLTTLTTNWARLICSAAPGSTITMAEMFVYENSATVSRLMSALAAVHRYRGVRVRVLVQRGGYYPGGQWASLLRHFSFAEVHYCVYGCHSDDPDAHAHTKFVVLSKTVFGRPAVLESSANWSHDQFDRQRQSGIYVYGNDALTGAYLHEWSSLATRAAAVPTAWRPAATGISYAFDPRPATTDPVAGELQALTCRPGDSVGVADTLLTRPTLVSQLTRLAKEGCALQVLIDPTGSVSASARAATRTTVVHDKFLVIDAHVRASGAARQEVVHGSENFSTGSMTLSDQQLLLVRRTDVFASYRWWFTYLWKRSAALPPVATPPATPPPVTPPTMPPPVIRPPTTSPTTHPPSDAVVRASACPLPIASADDDSTVATCAARWRRASPRS